MEVPPPHPRAPWLLFGQWMGVCILEGFGPGDGLLITLCAGLIFLAESSRETTKISLECGSKTLGRSSNNTWNFLGGEGYSPPGIVLDFSHNFFFSINYPSPVLRQQGVGVGASPGPYPPPASPSQFRPISVRF